MSKLAFSIFILVSVFGLVVLFWLWPEQEQLPRMSKVKDIKLDSVFGDSYQFNNQKIKVVTFFYTNCPDVCPLTMMDFKALQSKLKERGVFGKEVELVAITLDPEYDKPDVIREYAKHFDVDSIGWKWLRGTQEETKQVAAELNIAYQKVKGGFFTHTMTMYLIDQHNIIRAYYDMASKESQLDQQQILTDIDTLLEAKQ